MLLAVMSVSEIEQILSRWQCCLRRRWEWCAEAVADGCDMTCYGWYVDEQPASYEKATKAACTQGAGQAWNIVMAQTVTANAKPEERPAGDARRAASSCCTW